METRALAESRLYFVVRHYVDAPTLQKLRNQGRRFTVPETIDVARQVLEALTPAHRQNLPHGGVKPSNLFLLPDGRVLLGDPTMPPQAGGDRQRLAYDYRYAAPETFRGGGAPGPAAEPVRAGLRDLRAAVRGTAVRLRQPVRAGGDAHPRRRAAARRTLPRIGCGRRCGGDAVAGEGAGRAIWVGDGGAGGARRMAYLVAGPTNGVGGRHGFGRAAATPRAWRYATLNSIVPQEVPAVFETSAVGNMEPAAAEPTPKVIGAVILRAARARCDGRGLQGAGISPWNAMSP